MQSNPSSFATLRTVLFLFLALLSPLFLDGCASVTGKDRGSLFYPAPPQRPRVQYLTSYAGAEDIEGKPSLLMTFLVGSDASSRRMRKPTAVAAYDGVIYVADTGWDTVLVIDLKVGTFETIRDRGDGKLNTPVAIAIDEQGNKFVADVGRHQVVQFNANNTFIRAFGNPNELRPSGVALKDQLLYVVNRAMHRVEVFDQQTGERLRTFGDFGEEEAEFNMATSISTDSRGHIFVTDATNFRVQEFDADEDFVQSFGFLGDGPGTFARPKGTSADLEGHLYTVDAAFQNVQVWDTSNAHVILAFGGGGMGPGNLYLPSSVHVNYELAEYFREFVDEDFNLEYVILVANNYGPNKIAVYGFVTPKDPGRYEEFSPPDDEDEYEDEE